MATWYGCWETRFIVERNKKDGRFLAWERNRERCVFLLVRSVGQRKNSESPRGIEPQTFRFCALMLYHWAIETPLPISIYKYYAINIADPSNMQDACHINFVINLAHCGVSVAQWWSIGVWNPKVQGSILHGDLEFFFVPCLWQDKKRFTVS